MKKKVFISAIIGIVLTCLFIKIYNTNATYTLPKERWLGIDEGMEYNGIKYELSNVDIFNEEKFCQEFNLTKEDISYGGIYDDAEKKYFVVKLKLTIMEDDYNFELAEIGMYGKYESGYTAEYNLMSVQKVINELYKKQIKKGETVELNMIYKLSTLNYRENTLKNLTANDIAAVIHNMEEGCMYYFCKGGRID